ncbi:MAG: FtsX-like permease family protein [Acidimicrobiia bacterium]|nr:FtsX-like permease family protein [Acidimicrobiia bacterium]
MNQTGAERYKIRVGDRVPLHSVAADEADAFESGRYDQITFHGPTPTVHVVGVVRTWLDLGQVSYANSYFFGSPAFYRAYGDQIFGFPPQLAVLLQHPSGATRFVETANATVEQKFPASAEQFNGRTTKTSLTSIRDATHVQAFSLAVVALAAAIAGLLGLALITVRTVTANFVDFPALGAMGITRPGRTGLMATTLLPGAVGGVILALVGATLASPLFPTAVARRTGPPPGITFDALTLLPGAVVLALVVLGSAAWTAYRWRPMPLVEAGLSVGPLDRFAGVLPPSPRVGVRWALPRRGGVAGGGRAAIIGAVIGVCALVAALTYAAGLDHLVRTPSAYGWTFDADAGGGNDLGATTQIRDMVLHNRQVGDVGLARIAGSVPLGSAKTDVYGFESVRGQFGPAVLSGREPIAPDEILLGTKLARETHKKIGSTVALVLGPGTPPATLRVVGLGVLPTIESDAFANGAAMTRAGLEGIPGDNQDARSFFDQNTHVDVLFRLAPGVNRTRVLTQLQQQKLVSSVAAPPSDVRNLDLVRSYPLWLAGFLAAVGLLAVVNALVVSARRRSQQVGILRALGLTRTQILGAISSQGAAMALAGAVVGIPVGIALGRWTWAASAHQLGVSQVLGAPLMVLFAVVGFGLVLLVLLGATAGWWAARATPATMLRAP